MGDEDILCPKVGHARWGRKSTSGNGRKSCPVAMSYSVGLGPMTPSPAGGRRAGPEVLRNAYALFMSNRLFEPCVRACRLMRPPSSPTYDGSGNG